MTPRNASEPEPTMNTTNTTRHSCPDRRAGALSGAGAPWPPGPRRLSSTRPSPLSALGPEGWCRASRYQHHPCPRRPASRRALAEGDPTPPTAARWARCAVRRRTVNPQTFRTTCAGALAFLHVSGRHPLSRRTQAALKGWTRCKPVSPQSSSFDSATMGKVHITGKTATVTTVDLEVRHDEYGSSAHRRAPFIAGHVAAN